MAKALRYGIDNGDDTTDPNANSQAIAAPAVQPAPAMIDRQQPDNAPTKTKKVPIVVAGGGGGAMPSPPAAPAQSGGFARGIGDVLNEAKQAFNSAPAADATPAFFTRAGLNPGDASVAAYQVSKVNPAQAQASQAQFARNQLVQGLYQRSDAAGHLIFDPGVGGATAMNLADADASTKQDAVNSARKGLQPLRDAAASSLDTTQANKLLSDAGASPRVPLASAPTAPAVAAGQSTPAPALSRDSQGNVVNIRSSQPAAAAAPPVTAAAPAPTPAAPIANTLDASGRALPNGIAFDRATNTYSGTGASVAAAGGVQPFTVNGANNASSDNTAQPAFQRAPQYDAPTTNLSGDTSGSEAERQKMMSDINSQIFALGDINSNGKRQQLAQLRGMQQQLGMEGFSRANQFAEAGAKLNADGSTAALGANARADANAANNATTMADTNARIGADAFNRNFDFQNDNKPITDANGSMFTRQNGKLTRLTDDKGNAIQGYQDPSYGENVRAYTELLNSAGQDAADKSVFKQAIDAHNASRGISPSANNPPPEAIAELRKNRNDPKYLASFEKHFPGMSKQYLGGNQ